MNTNWLKYIFEYGPLALAIPIFEYFGTSGLIFFILIIVIIRLFAIILDKDLNERWRARFYKIIYKINGSSNAEKKYIENNACSRLNLARRKMPFEKEYLPKAIRIEWFGDKIGKTAQIKENEILIRLDPAERQEKNIVLLADALVKETSLIGIRHILNEASEASMDLNLVKSLLKETGDRKILDWFLRNEYQTALGKINGIGKWNEAIVEIDERGLFTRLLLVELEWFSKRISGRSSPEFFKEVIGLVKFLYKIATKVYKQDVPLEYTSRNIKIGVILVGKTSKILRRGIEPFLKAFMYQIQKQFTSIYVIEFDKELLGVSDPKAHEYFMNLTKSLTKEIEKRFEIKKDFDLSYDCIDSMGRKRHAKICHYIPHYAFF